MFDIVATIVQGIVDFITFKVKYVLPGAIAGFVIVLLIAMLFGALCVA